MAWLQRENEDGSVEGFEGKLTSKYFILTVYDPDGLSNEAKILLDTLGPEWTYGNS